MKLITYGLVLLSVFLLAHSVCPQVPSTGVRRDAPWIGLSSRHDQLRADILRDISTLKPPDQAKYLAKLGDVLWDVDKEHGKYWTVKGIDLALDPATPYRNRQERIDVLEGLISSKVLKNDEPLSKRLVGALSQVLLATSTVHDQEYNAALIFLADHLVQKDVQTAFDLGVRSLNGKHPALNSKSAQFFKQLKAKDPSLSDLYFSKLIEVIKRGGDRSLLGTVLERSAYPSGYDDSFSLQISDSQKKELIEILIPVIQSESRELLRKQRADCGFAKTGRRLLVDIKTLVPLKASIVEEAIDLCQKSNIEPWNKPDFLKGKILRTSQDFLEMSKTISDRRTQTYWIYFAALKARDEKNYRSAIGLLDSIDTSSNEGVRQGWDWTRIQVSVKLIEEFIDNNSLAEIDGVIDDAPSQLRPYILLEVLGPYGAFGRKYAELNHKLLNRAKAEFARMDFPLPKGIAWTTPVNPAKFLNLVNGYYRQGYHNEAVVTLEQFVELQNQLSKTYVGKDTKGRSVSYFHFSLDGRFIEANFESVCQYIGLIEATPIRLQFRLNILWQTTRNGSMGGSGTIAIE